MKILVFSELLHKGGGTSTLTTAEYLKKASHEVEIVQTVKQFKSSIKNKPAIILHHNIRRLITVARIAKRNKIPLIATINNHVTCMNGTHLQWKGKYLTPYTTASFFQQFLYQCREYGVRSTKEKALALLSFPIRYILMKQRISTLNKVAGVIAISPTIKRLLHANGVHRDIFVSPQPIDDSFITKEREDKNFLFFQSAAEPFKGAHLAIEALENTSYKLTIAGKIRDNQTLPKSDNVTILNDIPHEQMKEFDRTCSLFLFPALWEEAFGRGWAEAACTGAPIIAFNRGAPNDYLTQKENAYIIEPEQLKETLTFLINNPEERARIGGNAQEYAKTNLIASIVVPKLLQYYTHVLTSTTSSSQFEEQHYPSHLKT